MDANALAAHYSRFRVSERLLLTGHSHQAWPDVAFEAQQRAWLDAAEHVDDKWERALAVADDVRDGWRRLLNDPGGTIALGQNTHELVVRFLSAVLPMFCSADPHSPQFPTRPTRRTLLTTDGEFHTIRRQLDRLAEEGVEILKVAARPADTLSERLAREVDDRAAAVLVSSVLFETAEIVPHLALLAERCARHGAALLVDAYHHVNVIPFDVAAMGLATAFVAGGGYKYCQLGEGNCFLRVPRESDLRPVITGWFSEFAELAAARSSTEVRYGVGAARWAGATYDPASHYRAAAVFAFHQEHGLTPPHLRAINQRQVTLLADAVDALDLPPTVARVVPIAHERRGGFLAIECADAAGTLHRLRAAGVLADARGSILRLGPAPYLSDRQLREAVEHFGRAARGVD